MIARIPDGKTVIAPADYTVDLFMDDLVEIIMDGNLDSRNPTREDYGLTPGGTCMYEAPDGTRCLVGEWLHRRGHETSRLDDAISAGSDILDGLGYPEEVATIADRLQARLDGIGLDGSKPPLWGSILEARINI